LHDRIGGPTKLIADVSVARLQFLSDLFGKIRVHRSKLPNPAIA
jgi:hypothetical protein